MVSITSPYPDADALAGTTKGTTSRIDPLTNWARDFAQAHNYQDPAGGHPAPFPADYPTTSGSTATGMATPCPSPDLITNLPCECKPDGTKCGWHRPPGTDDWGPATFDINSTADWQQLPPSQLELSLKDITVEEPLDPNNEWAPKIQKVLEEACIPSSYSQAVTGVWPIREEKKHVPMRKKYRAR